MNYLRGGKKESTDPLETFEIKIPTKMDKTYGRNPYYIYNKV